MAVLGMKRGREEDIETLKTMANCLVLLSRGSSGTESASTSFDSQQSCRVFECKTCNRQFPSFQALGGHRASHKKPRLMDRDSNQRSQLESLPAKPKTHECSICGLEFAIGQALGGHMRRHRAAATSSESQSPELPLFPSQVPVVKRSNSRRVLCLDLNLTPLENGLDFPFEKVTPMLHCYL
ncbi:Zinc finger protein [Actinidia chinensis var. chinensis]|uniref:Zinc finger protein n=1 Tax=Actinidia chinensis var. chinensis TaxID=1590841 RepID=A0A2R6PL77_ACTCC|nr:Zinc finger protein [Actinidia chinensis var. chinensis]